MPNARNGRAISKPGVCTSHPPSPPRCAFPWFFAFQRKFSFVTSLKDFAQYFDCLDDVAFISIGPHEYYKVTFRWPWPARSVVGYGKLGLGAIMMHSQCAPSLVQTPRCFLSEVRSRR